MTVARWELRWPSSSAVLPIAVELSNVDGCCTTVQRGGGGQAGYKRAAVKRKAAFEKKQDDGMTAGQGRIPFGG